MRVINYRPRHHIWNFEIEAQINHGSWGRLKWASDIVLSLVFRVEIFISEENNKHILETFVIGKC